MVGQIMRTRSTLTKLLKPEEQIDEVFVELTRTAGMPRIKQWWIHDARLRWVSPDSKRDAMTISTLGLTSVSRVDLKVKWAFGTGKLTIRILPAANHIRQTVKLQQCVPRDWEHLEPRVRRFLNLDNNLQAHVI